MLALAAIVDHDCIGEACRPCMVIKAAGYFLNTIKLAAVFVFFAVAKVLLIQRSEKPPQFNTRIYSPIISKVRLNT